MLLNRRKKGGKKKKGVCFHEASIHDTLGNGFGHGSFVCLFVCLCGSFLLARERGLGFDVCLEIENDGGFGC
jgi:hypothetical protein